MIELFDHDIHSNGRRSSKGNQLKWQKGAFWYKADYTGYEGLSEYMVSHLLQMTDIDPKYFIVYDTEEIQYKHQIYRGCVSRNFLKKGWQLITLERLFQTMQGQSLCESIFKIENAQERVTFLVEQIQRLTGLKEFGTYMSILMTIDAFFLNEDRHLHNIAVLMDDLGNYQYCPIFDQGGALFSDTTMDYPLAGDLEVMMQEVKAKTFHPEFDEQLDAVEALYGCNLHLKFGWKDVEKLLKQEPYYPESVKKRVDQMLHWQIRKYQYLFI